MSEKLTEKELEQKALRDSLERFQNNKNSQNSPTQSTDAFNAATTIPTQQPYKSDNQQQVMSKESDPDLIIDFDMVSLPSKGVFYQNKIAEIKVEYLTSKDEDLITTPSLIENGTVIDELLRRKIKTPGINVGELLAGDRSAIMLFLRSSSYGHEYNVEVPDPRSGKRFQAVVDLTKLKYKNVSEMPDENGHFFLELPMRKKVVKIRLLSSYEDETIFRNAEAQKEAYGREFSEYQSMKLTSHILEIGGNTDRTYIRRFVDAMPAGDSLAIRRKVLDVSPEIDMRYEFKAPDGYKFIAPLAAGIDFFFPSL